ncbi:MAG: response regulator [Clostridia bacterium]
MAHKLLIVDDETNIRMTLKQCFSAEKYDIDMAVNGQEALKKITDNDYDVVLLDIRMPGLTGLEVLEKVRENNIDVDVVMMTAYGSVEKAVEAMKLGAIDFIGKPFTPTQIREIVDDVLARDKLIEEELDGYKDNLQFAKKNILDKNYTKGEQYLKKAVALGVDQPEPHNLLGVIAEYNGNLDQAQKHYRAAIALDPTFSPARANLTRTSSIQYTKRDIDLGDNEVEKEEK